MFWRQSIFTCIGAKSVFGVNKCISCFNARVIQNEIHNALAKRLLDHQFDDGDRIVIDLDAKADALTFQGVSSDQSAPNSTEAHA